MDDKSSNRPSSRLAADDAHGVLRRSGDARRPLDNSPDPYADEAGWPAWKVTVFVIAFSGACWWAIAYILGRLFG